MTDPHQLANRRARAQHGVVSRAQLLTAGFTKDQIAYLVKTRRLLSLHAGVYLMAAVGRSREAELTAALLAAGEGAFASHRTAVAVWVPGCELGQPEITTVAGFAPRLEGVIVHRTTIGLTPLDVVKHGIWRVARPALALLQLGAVAGRAEVERAVEAAVLADVVEPRELEVLLDRFGGPGNRGAATLRAILEARTGSPESELEWELLGIIRRYCSFEPAVQHWVTTSSGHRFRLDVAVPDVKVALEAQGWRWHGGKAKTQQDRRRRNALVADGWFVLEYDWADCRRRPRSVGREIEATVARRRALAS
jgi:very-short-patch-repair endonuclease